MKEKEIKLIDPTIVRNRIDVLMRARESFKGVSSNTLKHMTDPKSGVALDVFKEDLKNAVIKRNMLPKYSDRLLVALMYDFFDDLEDENITEIDGTDLFISTIMCGNAYDGNKEEKALWFISVLYQLVAYLEEWIDRNDRWKIK